MQLLENIRVVPDYPSNYQLACRIRERLAEYIDDSLYHRSKPPPKIVIFRPTGRPGDEFREAVAPILDETPDILYLVVAFSGQFKDISELVPYSQKDRVKITESIFIQFGQLVPENSQNAASNQKTFERIAYAICKDYNLPTRCPQKGGQKESKSWKGTFFHLTSQATLHLTSQAISMLKFSCQYYTDVCRSNRLPDFLRSKSSASESDYIFVQDITHLGAAIRIIEDFPEGIPQDDLCKIMDLNDTEKTAMIETLDWEKTVFTTDTRNGQMYIKFSKLFKEKTARMKGSSYYSQCLINYNREGQQPDISFQQLKGLTVSDTADPNDMEVVVSTDAENKAEVLVISLDDVCTFMDQYRNDPCVLDQELVSLIEEEFEIPDQLIQRLYNLCKDHGMGSLPSTFAPAFVNTNTLVDVMEISALQFDEKLQTAIKDEFEISADDVNDGLQRICARMKERLANSVKK